MTHHLGDDHGEAIGQFVQGAHQGIGVLTPDGGMFKRGQGEMKVFLGDAARNNHLQCVVGAGIEGDEAALAVRRQTATGDGERLPVTALHPVHVSL